MQNPILVRPVQAGEETQLRDIFYSSVHGIACAHYTLEQRSVWAPEEYDTAAWEERIRRNRPFVAERNGTLVGFADVQPDGYIDQFFVAESAAGQGIGGALMRRLEQHARSLKVAKLTSNVSLTAQPFFMHFGFSIEVEQTVVVRGIAMKNAKMFKMLSID